MEIILLVAACVLSLMAVMLIIVFRPKSDSAFQNLEMKLAELQSGLSKIESNCKEDFRINREEIAAIARDSRMELSSTLNSITEQSQHTLKEINATLSEKVGLLITTIEGVNKSTREDQTKSLKEFTMDQTIKFDGLKGEQKEASLRTAEQLEKIATKVEEKLLALEVGARKDGSLMRDSLIQAFKDFGETFDKNVASFNDLQKEKFALMESKQNELVKGTETKLETIRSTVEEKLEKTLSERLGQSFETVGKQLIEVQKGLGEMQTIAADVGGLKKVLSNVKLRGGVGEVQLAMLLEQLLAPNQYEANVRTKAGSSDAVEFAIKLPGRSEDEGSIVYLPIDAKFPKDSYEHLVNAYENAIPDDIEAATKSLEATIRKMAKDIRDKYIDPPHTTDFAIMFLPFESIYAEVIRRSTLVDQLRDEFKISVAGPTTLMAILNSLQMGFRTLALQKRSSEVWTVLSKVKSEFENFGGMLSKAQKNFQTGLGQLEDVMGTRTRAIMRQLKTVESLPAAVTEVPALLPDNMLEPATDES